MDEYPWVADAASGEDRELNVEQIRAGLAGSRLGEPLVYFPAIDSTNSWLKANAAPDAPEGMVALTDNQTAGRGRIGRQWKVMPHQQLTFSILTRPACPPYFLMMASALAVATAIETVAGVTAGIKWPNDVLVSGKKVCGILIETSSAMAIVGVGLNVNGSLAEDAELCGFAATLQDVTGRRLSREQLAIAIISRFDELYSRLKTDGLAAQQQIRQLWSDHLTMLGHPVRVLQNGTYIAGIAEAVDEDGALLVRGDDGVRHTITWGDVSA